MLEVGDRRALAQEFGVRRDRAAFGRAMFLEQGGDLVARPDRHGRLGHHHHGVVERFRQFLDRGEDIAQIGMAVAAPRRRADGDEHRLGLADRLLRGRW